LSLKKTENIRQKIEEEVDLVLCGILLQVFELRNSFEPKKLPVKFASKREQEIFDFFISVLTTGGAVWTKSKNHKNMQK
jgi:hypothetical protein